MIKVVKRKMNGWIIGLLIGLIVAGGVVGFLAWERARTYHLLAVQPGVLYRSGQQGTAQLARAIDSCKIKTVVSLIDPQELADPAKPQFKEEAVLLQQKGVALESVPVPLGGWPSSGDVQKFLKLTEDARLQPVLVHCAQGVRRTGMMVAAYEMSVMNYDKARTREAIEGFGHSRRTTADIEKFIEIYEPVNRVVTEQPAPGKE